MLKGAICSVLNVWLGTISEYGLFCRTLSQRNYWEKILSVIAVYPEAVPIEILNSAILTAPQKAAWVEIMIGLLTTAPAEKLTDLGPDVRLV